MLLDVSISRIVRFEKAYTIPNNERPSILLVDSVSDEDIDWLTEHLVGQSPSEVEKRIFSLEGSLGQINRSGRDIEKELDLSYFILPTLNLERSVMYYNFRLKESRIIGRAEFTGMSVGDDIDFEGLKVLGPLNMNFYSATKTNLRRIWVGADANLRTEGTVQEIDLRGANIVGNVDLVGKYDRILR